MSATSGMCARIKLLIKSINQQQARKRKERQFCFELWGVVLLWKREALFRCLLAFQGYEKLFPESRVGLEVHGKCGELRASAFNVSRHVNIERLIEVRDGGRPSSSFCHHFSKDRPIGDENRSRMKRSFATSSIIYCFFGNCLGYKFTRMNT